MTLSLDPGTVCSANGRVIQIDGPDSLTNVLARDMATGEMISVPIAKITPLPIAPKTKSAAELSESEWKRCTALARDLKPLKDRPTVPRAELEELAKRHGMSIRQLQRVRAKYLKDARVSSLARNRGGRPSGLNLLDPKVDSLIRHAIAKYYFRRERPPKEYVVERAQSLARRLQLPEPSRKAVLLRLSRELGWASDRAREGNKKAKQKWEIRTGGLSVARPLEVVQIDHTPADVLVLTDDRLKVLGRPWVTIAIDVATRCVLGVYVSMDPPSSVSVSLCIEHAVLPKSENDQDPGIWPMYGKPERILVDNGKDFRSLALQRGCAEHGIELSWRPVRTPHYGAHIERLIGTLMKICHLLPGTTFSNIKERGDYDSEGRARLTLSEFQQWMTQKICRHYHTRLHRGIGMRPVTAWEHGFTTADGRFVAPPMVANQLEFRMDFLPYAFRKVRRTGIELNASRYWHEDLGPMLNAHTDALVNYDPRNPGQVWVRRQDGLLVVAPAIGGRAANAPTARLALDRETLDRLNAERDAGFEATDQIEASAERATREARKAQGSGSKKRNAASKSANESLAYIGDSPASKTGKHPAIEVEVWN